MKLRHRQTESDGDASTLIGEGDADTFCSEPPEQIHPTTAPNLTDGVYNLPIGRAVMSHECVSDVPTNGDENTWRRYDDMSRCVGGCAEVVEGDILHIPRKVAQSGWWDGGMASPGLFYVSETHDGVGTLYSITISEAEQAFWAADRDGPVTVIDEVTVPTDSLIQEVEYGCAAKATTIDAEVFDYLRTGNRDAIEQFNDSQPKGSVDNLVLTREESGTTISRFINHPIVGHVLGCNYDIRYVTFGARYGGKDGSLAAVVDLVYPNSPELDGERYVQIGRYASHPNRPENTGSWLLSRAVRWAKLEGFGEMISYAGVGGNKGSLYRSLGFTNDSYDHNQSDGAGWTNRENRSAWADYDRDRYDKQLFDTDASIHRRDFEATHSLDSDAPHTTGEASQQRLCEFDTTPTSTLPTVRPERASGLSLATPDNNLYYARWDGAIDEMKAVIARYGNQTVNTIDSVDADAAFVAANGDGVIAAMLVSTSDDYSAVKITAYGEVDVDTDTNTAAILAGRVREWCGLSGYQRVVATPTHETELYTALKQCGFDLSK